MLRRLAVKSAWHSTCGSSWSRARALTPVEGLRLVSTNAARKSSKKEESVVKFDLNALRQVVLDGETAPNEESVHDSGWPTVLQQVQNNMRRFSHCVVLTRIGNFYELYFEHATVYGDLLNLKQASKRAKDTRVPMAGFPYFQLDRYLKILVQDLGKSVAISEERVLEEHERIKYGGLKCDRQVTRVVTPGTLIDEHFLSPFEHNYLLAVDWLSTWGSAKSSELESRQQDPSVGLSWLDLSSGTFATQSVTLDGLASAIARIGPREILTRTGLEQSAKEQVRDVARSGDAQLTAHEVLAEEEVKQKWASMLEEQTLTGDAVSYTEAETSAARLLLDYVSSRLPGLQLSLQAPIQQKSVDFMAIDRNSLRSLEITKTMAAGALKGSLLHAVRRTSTESGARLLSRRLVSPSTSMSEINHRLDLVETLREDQALLEQLVSLLRKTSDTLRLVQRFSLGRGDADDLLRLARTIYVIMQVRQVLARHSGQAARLRAPMHSMAKRFHWEGPMTVANRIVETIDEKGLDMQHQQEEAEEAEAVGKARSVLSSVPQQGDMAQLQKRVSLKTIKKAATDGDNDLGLEDIYIMKRTASVNLARLHDDLDNLRHEKVALAEKLRHQLKAESLALKSTPGLGYVCHVRGKDTKLDLSEVDRARTVSSSKSTRSFYMPEWTNLGRRIDEAKARVHAEERATFKELRDLVIDHILALRHNAAILDELDVSASFARLALELNLKRPVVNHGSETKIFGGRHIMVDAGLNEAGRQFTPNDCHIGGSSSDSEHIWLITGPNMAGKSTFLRQTVLISILAQTGSFVPAEYAEIGLVDQIFSRVGSADNLSQDQSTFMVEMLETAPILKHATERSFVIMDEVGRGTTPEDGIAVGYAVLEHLRKTNRCRALFATHFHTLADMTEDWKEVGAYCTDVKEEEDGSFRYDHRMRRGINRESHALKVARLAGMPDSVVRSAETVLWQLRKENSGVN